MSILQINIMKKTIITLLLIVLSITLIGCGEQANIDKGETIKVTHSLGEAEITTDVKKAVVFDLGILDIMHNLGVEVELGLPVDSLPEYLNDYKTAMNAGSMKESNQEKIYEFKPDVIIISARLAAEYDQLSVIAPTVYVELNSETFMDDLKSNIELVGKIFNKEDTSSAYVTEIEDLVTQTQAVSATVIEKALIVLVNGSTFSAYGSGSRFGLVHDVLNVKQVDTNIESSTHGQSINYEYLIDKNPEIIFVIDRAAVVNGEVSTDLLENQIIANVNAIKNDKVVYLDAVAWYLVSGGITSTKIMINEIKAGISN